MPLGDVDKRDVGVAWRAIMVGVAGFGAPERFDVPNGQLLVFLGELEGSASPVETLWRLMHQSNSKKFSSLREERWLSRARIVLRNPYCYRLRFGRSRRGLLRQK
ncbi:hypothetical protein [Corynebacterium diphtheriae]|uniref:hypothetical protein n=1 Tax=Corynebacterium diphtheriae TaxID=1717 RepID=UPI003BF55DEA